MNIICRDLLVNYNDMLYIEKLYKCIGNVEYMEIKPNNDFSSMVDIKCVTYSHELLQLSINFKMIKERLIAPQKLAELF